MTTVLLLLALLFIPVKDQPDVKIVLREASSAEVCKAMGLPAGFAKRLDGKISLVVVEVRGSKFTARATGFRIPGDPVSRIDATGDWKDRTVKVKAWAFGGLVEYEGQLP